MEFLHSQDIIHRDLACRNILVSGQESEYVVKIADFGLSYSLSRSNNPTENHRRILPIRWTAPEVFSNHQHTQTADVWSFGIVLWEIYSRGSIPYAGLTNAEVVGQVNQGFRLIAPVEAPNTVRQLLCNQTDHPIFVKQVLISLSCLRFMLEKG